MVCRSIKAPRTVRSLMITNNRLSPMREPVDALASLRARAQAR